MVKLNKYKNKQITTYYSMSCIEKEIDRKENVEEKKTYKCMSSSRSNTLFNRKLARVTTKPRRNYSNKTNNQFYVNHYPLHNGNGKIFIENIRQKSIIPPISSKFNNKLNPGGINNSEFSSAVSNSVKYCVNCGNYGHIKGQCSEPNISNGVIAVRYNDTRQEYEYLIVQRKHSHGYCDLVRGKYSDNVQHIQQLLEETTLEERVYLLEEDFLKNWHYLWGATNEILNKFKHLNSIEKKFNALRKKYLLHLCPEIKSTWVEPEWGFPKGQRDGCEKNIETAFREFSEESGYKNNQCVCVSNLMPLHEVFTGSNNKQYKQLYFMAFMKYDDTCGEIHYQKNEIGDARWVNFDELVSKIRYYDVEKIKVASTVKKLLQESFFVFV